MALKSILNSVDQKIARALLPFSRQSNGRVLAFHALCESEQERKQQFTHPTYTHTVEELRQCIAFFLEQGFVFGALSQLEHPSGTIFLTFDDGYANNMLALPILQEFGVPATFFIVTDYVQHPRRFWWDVLWQMNTAHASQIEQQFFQAEQAETYLVEQFGREILACTNENRPLSMDEVRHIASQLNLTIGNHTHTHATLTHLPKLRIIEEICVAQGLLASWGGEAVLPALAYPNGAWSSEVLEAAEAAQMQLGFTTQHNTIDGLTQNRLRLPRFSLRSDQPFLTQLRYIASDFSMLQRFRG
jgi:peptidoglycan/xylan/chitin deacetylase (PgdA/CDA1 family)